MVKIREILFDLYMSYTMIMIVMISIVDGLSFAINSSDIGSLTNNVAQFLLYKVLL